MHRAAPLVPCTATLATLLTLSGLPAQGTNERIALVVRQGKLAEAEVSPSPQLNVPALWKLALEGISLTRVEFKAGVTPPGSLDALKPLLLPDGTNAELVEWRGRSEGETGTKGGAKALEALFGTAPEPTPAETAGVTALRAALGSRSVIQPSSQRSTASTSDLSWLARAAVTVVRVDAGSDAASFVSERDELLGKVIEKSGLAANIIVVSLPERGAGTVIARGPRFKRARVSEKPRSISVVKGMVSLLLDPTAAEKNPGIAEELVHELFR